jgi:hypothetical protein
MIGCFEDAQLIGEWDHNYPLPDGWGYVDEGEERAVFTSPDKVIYKVELNSSGANHSEYFNICMIELQESIKNWRVPEASLYELDKFHSVIAMEYIDGDNPPECGSILSTAVCTCNEFPCVGVEWEMVSVLWGVIDLNCDNVRLLSDGTKVLVDVSR